MSFFKGMIALLHSLISSIVIARLEPTMDLVDEQMASVHRRSLACAWSAQGFREMITLPTVIALGAFEDRDRVQNLVGLICFQKTMNMCDILTLCVLPEYRRQGLGTSLMHAMLDFSSSQNILYTLEVAQNNQAALKLYERWGFTIQGTRPQYYRTQGGTESAYVMTCCKPARSLSSDR